MVNIKRVIQVRISLELLVHLQTVCFAQMIGFYIPNLSRGLLPEKADRRYLRIRFVTVEVY